MNLNAIVIGLMLVAPMAGQAGNMQLADREALDKERVAWRAINMEELKLRRELAAAHAEWAPLAQVEREHTNLVQQVESATTLIKALSERRYREWTSTRGAKVFARISFQSKTVLRLKNEQGEEMEILVADLSPPDRAHLARIDRALSSPAETPAAPPEAKLIGLDDTLKKTVPVRPDRKY